MPQWEEKDPEERRKWLLLDDAKQALEKVEELYTINSFNLHKFKKVTQNHSPPKQILA